MVEATPRSCFVLNLFERLLWGGVEGEGSSRAAQVPAAPSNESMNPNILQGKKQGNTSYLYAVLYLLACSCRMVSLIPLPCEQQAAAEDGGYEL